MSTPSCDIMPTDVDARKIMKRWSQIQYIHSYFTLQKLRGSMENALSRIGCRFINRNDFIVSVLDEFQIPAPTMHIHKHLKLLYETFPGWNFQHVDGCALLCTYLSVVFKDSVETNPCKVFCNFCDIYSLDGERIRLREILNILCIGCVTNVDFMHCSDMIVASSRFTQSKSDSCSLALDEIYMTKSDVKALLDYNPSILIHFRDSILNKLNIKKRIDMLNDKEVGRFIFLSLTGFMMNSPGVLYLLYRQKREMSQEFQHSSDRLVLRRAILMWNDILYKSFEAWAQVSKEKSRCRLLEMRMLYWRVLQIVRVWRFNVFMKSKLKVFFHHICEIHVLHKMRQSFKRWNLMRKIHNACRFNSNTFKLKALALTMMRIGRFNIMKKQCFFLWRDEIKFELKLIWASKIWCIKMKKRHLMMWKDCSTRLQLKRKEAEHKRWAMAAIEDIKASMLKVGEVAKKNEETITTKVSKQASKVSREREKITSEFDRGVLMQQKNDRLKRYEHEKKNVSKDWDLKWSLIEQKRIEKIIEKTTKCLNTTNGQNDELKQVKKFESKLRSPSSTLSQLDMIAIALLDGKLAQRGILAETFFSELRQQTDQQGMILQNSFVSSLEKVGIEMTPSLIRDIFDEVKFKDKANRKIQLNLIEEKMKATYEHFGTQGSRYKVYISQCHGMIICHDIHTNEVVLEHDMSRKLNKAVARDHLIAKAVIKERKETLLEKNKLWRDEVKKFAATKIQRGWLSQKAITKTKLRITLHAKKL